MFSEFSRLRRDMNRLFSDFDQQFGAVRDPFLALGSAPDPFWDATDVRALTGPTATVQPVQGAGKGQAQSQGQGQGQSTALTTAGDDAGALWNMPAGMGLGTLKPITADVVEREKEFVITADVPGLTRSDVSVSVDNGILTIKGERRHAYDSERNKPAAGAGAGAGAGVAEFKGAGAGDLKDNKAQGGGAGAGTGAGAGATGAQAQAPAQTYFRRIERSYGQVSRSFKLPPNVDSNKIAAKHENGVLTITLPKIEKKATAPPQNISIA